jgi:ATPase subunit of ABC transporter with duplicated ATPase domains
MLQVQSLAYEHNPLFGPLFSDLSFSVESGEKVALVGPNGCGKSTILKLIVDELPLQKGRILLDVGSTIGYLPQDFDFNWNGSMLDALLEQVNLEDRAERTARILRLAHRFGLESRCLDLESNQLSLGERTRAGMIGVFAEEPDLLLLDEPTNHLDVEARIFLESVLQQPGVTVLMVCHDRRLLDTVVTRTLQLDRGVLTEYAGGYTAMQTQKRQAFDRNMETYEKHIGENRRLRIAQERLKQNAVKVAGRPTSQTYDPKQSPFYKARAARVDKRAKAIRTRVEHMTRDNVSKPFERVESELTFPSVRFTSSEVASCSQLWKCLGDKELFGGMSLMIERGTKTAIVGPNGSGKTTLIRLLLGELQPDRGEVKLALNTRVGYLSQARMQLDEHCEVLQSLGLENTGQEQFARALLGRLGIQGDAVHKPVSALSVGERTKAELVRILVQPVNLLVLDEPTNHLDIESIEAMENALKGFPGAVLFVSHDREFVDRLADQIIELGTGAGGRTSR